MQRHRSCDNVSIAHADARAVADVDHNDNDVRVESAGDQRSIGRQAVQLQPDRCMGRELISTELYGMRREKQDK